ncbi:MAG: hypothetical protein IKR48_05180 [Kiritimatiellae bacterium]|nr:hypothetical protein [Kiritimatiellia bacterium]
MRCMRFALVLALVALTAGAEKMKRFATMEEARKAHAEALARVGGYVQRPAAGPSVLFVDEQRVVPSGAVREECGVLAAHVRVKWLCLDAPKGVQSPSVLHTNWTADAETACAVSVCDLPDFPEVCVFPGRRSAIVNVRPLAFDKPSEEVLRERFRKCLLRAFGFAFGAGVSHQYPMSALAPVDGVMGLDRAPCKGYGMDSMQTIQKTMERWGMPSMKKTSYKRACEEGWAPPPTNDVQRALWEAAKTNAPAMKAKAPVAKGDAK